MTWQRRATAGPPARPRFLGGAAALFAAVAAAAAQTAPPPPTLDDARQVLGKWIETQQIIARERKDWQQGKEILAGRLEVVQKESAALVEKIAQAAANAEKAAARRAQLEAENETLKAGLAQLTTAVAALEAEVRRLFPMVPQPLQEKLRPLFERIPADAAKSRVSTAERFQNVLGILDQLDKANSELTVAYEVHTLPGGRRAEVQVLYIGLAQAFYLSARGEAGIGRPAPDGWQWEPSPDLAPAVTTAIEIVQGKQTPAFVPLPVRIR